MEDILKSILKNIMELKQISQANNDLLGFICSKVAPVKKLQDKDISVS